MCSPSASIGRRSSTASRRRCWSSWPRPSRRSSRRAGLGGRAVRRGRPLHGRAGARQGGADHARARLRLPGRQRRSAFAAAADPHQAAGVRGAGHLLHARHRADAGRRHRRCGRRLPLRPDRGQARHHAGGRGDHPHGRARGLGQCPALPADRRRVRCRRGAAAGLRAGGGARRHSRRRVRSQSPRRSPSRPRWPCARRWPHPGSPSIKARTPPSASSTPSRRL